MRGLQEQILVMGLGGSLVLLGFINFTSSKNTTDLVANANRVQLTYEVLGDCTDFLVQMSNAESARRGLIYSNRQEELIRFQSAMIGIDIKRQRLGRYNQLDSAQIGRLQTLDIWAQERQSLLRKSILFYLQERSASALAIQNTITDESVTQRDQIQRLVTEIKTIEEQHLRTSIYQTRRNIQAREASERLALALSIGSVAGFAGLLYWGQRRQAHLQTLKQKLAQEQELNELKLRLFSMISHEFRTPLTVILASSQLLADVLEPQISKFQLKNLYRIQASTKLMNQLLTDILTLTRAEAGKLECRPTWIDIEAFCLNLLEDLQSSSSWQQTLPPPNLEFFSSGRCYKVYLDEKLLYSVLANLLLNAIKYSPTGKPIRLELVCDSSLLTFVVQDQGIGMTPTEQLQVFQPFYRSENVKNTPGTGLGLAVVKKCIELQQGHIRLESELGKGTTFWVTIPLHLPDASDVFEQVAPGRINCY